MWLFKSGNETAFDSLKLKSDVKVPILVILTLIHFSHLFFFFSSRQ